MADKKSSIGTIAEVRTVDEESAEISLRPGESVDFIESMIRGYSTLQMDDIRQQLDWRPKVLRFTAWGLVIQNILVFGLVTAGLFTHRLGDLKLVFSVLVGATLLQTAYIAKVMVQFLFSDIDYHDKEYSKWFKHLKNKKDI
jgi:hypothetical protein